VVRQRSSCNLQKDRVADRARLDSHRTDGSCPRWTTPAGATAAGARTRKWNQSLPAQAHGQGRPPLRGRLRRAAQLHDALTIWDDTPDIFTKEVICCGETITLHSADNQRWFSDK